MSIDDYHEEEYYGYAFDEDFDSAKKYISYEKSLYFEGKSAAELLVEKKAKLPLVADRLKEIEAAKGPIMKLWSVPQQLRSSSDYGDAYAHALSQKFQTSFFYDTVKSSKAYGMARIFYPKNEYKAAHCFIDDKGAVFRPWSYVSPYPKAKYLINTEHYFSEVVNLATMDMSYFH